MSKEIKIRTIGQAMEFVVKTMVDHRSGKISKDDAVTTFKGANALSNLAMVGIQIAKLQLQPAFGDLQINDKGTGK